MADENSTNTNNSTNLTLKIFSAADENNLLFNATNLTWAQIVDLWDECCDIYNGEKFEIIPKDDEDELSSNIVSSDLLNELKEKAGAYNGAYIGTLTWIWGHNKSDLFQAADSDDAVSKFKQKFINLLTQENYFSKSTNFDNEKETEFFKLFNIDVKPYSTVYQLSTTETTNTDSSGNETETGSSGNETGTGSSGEGTETGSSGEEPAPSNDTGD